MIRIVHGTILLRFEMHNDFFWAEMTARRPYEFHTREYTLNQIRKLF